MLDHQSKLFVDASSKEETAGFLDTAPNSLDFKDYGVALLIIAMCLFSISKLVSLQKFCKKTKLWLPASMNSSEISQHIDSLTSDLRMEMRGLSEQIIEFRKWSRLKEEMAKTYACACRKCNEAKRKAPSQSVTVLKRKPFLATHIDNELTECNWLQYFHRYVYNPNPRIVDTQELETIKRAYSNW